MQNVILKSSAHKIGVLAACLCLSTIGAAFGATNEAKRAASK